MNLNTIYNQLLDNYFLTNENWQKADYYELETTHYFWNKAILVTLSTAVAKTNSEALLYLLQKQAKVLGICEKEWQTLARTQLFN